MDDTQIDPVIGEPTESVEQPRPQADAPAEEVVEKVVEEVEEKEAA